MKLSLSSLVTFRDDAPISPSDRKAYDDDDVPPSALVFRPSMLRSPSPVVAFAPPPSRARKRGTKWSFVRTRLTDDSSDVSTTPC